MRVFTILILTLAMSTMALTAGQDGEKIKPARDYPPAFELFTKLAGNWVGKDASGHMGKEGKEVQANYRVTSAGTPWSKRCFPAARTRWSP